MNDITEQEKVWVDVDSFIDGLRENIDALYPRGIHVAVSKVPEEYYSLVFNALAKNEDLIETAVNKFISVQVDHSIAAEAKSYNLQLAKDSLRILCAYGAGVGVENASDLHTKLSHKRCENKAISASDHAIIGVNRIFDYIRVIPYDAITETVNSFSSPQLLSQYCAIIRSNPHLKLAMSDKETKKDIASHLKYLTSSQQSKPTRNFESSVGKSKNKLVERRGFGERRTFLHPYLYECSCSMFSRKTRSKIETQILNYAMEHLSKTDELTYVSLGAGGLLDDYIIIGKLLLAGFKYLNIVLVDPNVENDSLRQFSSLSSLAAEQQAQQFRIQAFSSISEFKDANQDAKVHLAVTIDFVDIFKKDGVFNDVMLLHSLLADKGRYFFSYSEYKLIMDKNSLVDVCVDSTKRLKNDFSVIRDKLLNDISLDGKTEVDYISVGLDFNFFEWIYILPALKRDELAKVTITMFQPRQAMYSGAIGDEINSGFNEKTMKAFLSLCLPGVGVGIRFIKSSMDRDGFPDFIGYKYDVITALYLDDTLRARLLPSDHSNSSVYAYLSKWSNDSKEEKTEIICRYPASSTPSATP